MMVDRVTELRKSRSTVRGSAEKMYSAVRFMGRQSLRCIFAVALLLTAHVAMAGTAEVLPDFSGTWERYPDPYDPNSRFPEDPPAPDGGPTLKKQYAEKYQAFLKRKDEAFKAGKPLATPSTQCLPEGMPTIMAAVNPIEILQQPHQIVVLAEFLTQTRRIYLNEEMPEFDDISPSYIGYSVGHWEGDTLVVKTIGVREDVKFHGIPRTESMEITERIRLTGPDLLENKITIHDPEVMAEPYQFTFGYRRNNDYRIMEYICDNNRYELDEDGGSVLDVSPR